MMSKSCVTLAATLLVSGCAATVISGNRTAVVIGKFGVLSVEEARPLAQAHCAGFGKHAELDHAGTRDMYFRCRENSNESSDAASGQDPTAPPAEQPLQQ